MMFSPQVMRWVTSSVTAAWLTESVPIAVNGARDLSSLSDTRTLAQGDAITPVSASATLTEVHDVTGGNTGCNTQPAAAVDIFCHGALLRYGRLFLSTFKIYHGSNGIRWWAGQLMAVSAPAAHSGEATWPRAL